MDGANVLVVPAVAAGAPDERDASQSFGMTTRAVRHRGTAVPFRTFMERLDYVLLVWGEEGRAIGQAQCPTVIRRRKDLRAAAFITRRCGSGPVPS